MGEIVKKEICKCEHCGNEAEMVVTCFLPDSDEREKEPSSSPPAKDPAPEKKRVKGTATCSHCGNEADMWIEF